MNIRKKHFDIFGKVDAIYVRSPGRINLIGEHTDYNDGFVLPAAIDKAIYFAVSKNNKGLFRFHAADYNRTFQIEVSTFSVSDTHWANYLLGVADQFIQAGCKIQGVDCVFGGNIPIGAGLSSSAAIETGFAFALDKLFNCKISKLKQVKMSQQAEHKYARVMCGIMDQFAIVKGKTNNAIMLDCRSLEYKYANINLLETDIILCDTKVKHSLALSEYNIRRKQCETGVQILQKHYSNIKALRDVDLNLLQKHKAEFDKTVLKRCQYVVEENKRVKQAFVNLTNGELRQFGKLMFQSHDGLKNKFDVSCMELDLLVDIAKKSKEVFGSRMMGGGFGGCTINLVKKEGREQFSKRIIEEYKKATGTIPNIYIVKIEDGTSEL